MLKALMKVFFGSKQDRDVRRMKPVVEEINEIYKELESISDEELRNKTSEFRALLGVVPRLSNVENQIILHEPAEEFLRTHPDVDRAVFLGTRRDANPGELVVWVKLKETSRASESLADGIRMGLGRLSPFHKPRTVFFIDQFPTKEDERGRSVIDYHKMMLAVEQTPVAPMIDKPWGTLSAGLKDEAGDYSLEDILPQAFAVMKETCRRHVGKQWTAAGAEIKWNAVPFDVQLMGGISLAQGNISEMATGEGKTLTAILPLYLHALMGRGSHLVTVNDYLAKRDSEWNLPLFQFLGMTVGCLDKTDSHTPQRRAQYQCDVTYGTVNEFGFDYLRDNMARQRQQLVQRDYAFAIIDEVDSVLIDEARTPLIISGPVDRSTDQYERILPLVRELEKKQNMVVSRLAQEAEKMLEAGGDNLPWEAGFKLLQCYKGLPKHKRYMKLRNEPTYQRLQERVELELMRDKRIREVEEDLFFLVDEKHRTVELTEKGRVAASPENPEYFTLPDIVDEFARIEQNEDLTPEDREAQKRESRLRHDQRAEELHALGQLLHAFALKQRDVDYVVEDNKVVIVDENTGRKMNGRRWSDGLHQAVEAKEGVKIEAETQTLATITIQNYFRMYKRLSGMTGTAETEAAEFESVYKMDVVTIPTNRPIQRKDMDDLVYRTKREKYAAVIEEVERLNKLGLPVLVGTTNVLDSEKLSKIFEQRKLKHNVLNAKNNEHEAQIVAEAGRPGAITIATNMAGRGTDIKLGEGVSEPRKDEKGELIWPGGLQIIGTERHESRRIDRQLRGRSGRQGDPGASRFFVSLEDNLMLWFGSDRISGWLQRLGMQDGEAIENPLVTRSITNAQKKVEMINQERRQRTLQFDDVMNRQRLGVYGLRREFLMEEDLRPVVLGVIEDAIDAEFSKNYGDKKIMGDADIPGFIDWVQTIIATAQLSDLKQKSWADYEDLHNAVMEHIAEAYDEKMELLEDVAIPFCRYIGLQTIDNDWQDHLLAIDDLREGINLRSYGQKDPLVEFTKDATRLFEQFMLDVNKNIFQTFFRAQPISEQEMAERQRVRRIQAVKAQALSAAEATAMANQAEAAKAAAEQQDQNGRPKSGLEPYRRDYPKVGRNEPCPCGSGKKYKDCHGGADLRERVNHTVGDEAERN
ncbi:preprotein translocase subunit SecA [bacterium]|nr:preprotein translocase subunit SecA [bacterium]